MSDQSTQPRTASAVTRAFFAALEDAGVSQELLSKKSGCHVNTFYGWKTGKSSANVPNMEAALAVLGLELCIRPINPNQGKLP
ncbi:helix-turn-helix transcriptional regulator [Mesorhizobium sp. M7A.F.Ca.CA.002.12.1.1]|uniref:helix-turn-helix domain-containing protein n=1 Tax=Mesorhizobium sp. M7A.F.Ca.CA.002.12.1.1 TaxID=2496735 RepID=UPI000FCA8541|nr:helix-turn-helix transcriptional regulator [Mesorhizobium sp. M7A.F.Ca.CA.002.12.1.1]RUX60199.1 XRE family transcriptional regulator [Mesorhizobium sp. M7A.F.Ca.CA.002.12.1.1]